MLLRKKRTRIIDDNRNKNRGGDQNWSPFFMFLIGVMYKVKFLQSFVVQENDEIESSVF